MRVQLVDPSADVLPYDHALAAALARQGAQVELVTSRFVHGPAPAPDGYTSSTLFFRTSSLMSSARAASAASRPTSADRFLTSSSWSCLA